MVNYIILTATDSTTLKQGREAKQVNTSNNSIEQILSMSASRTYTDCYASKG